MRVFLGVHKYSSLHGIIGDMGWADFKVHKYSGCIRLWNRIIKIDDSRIIKKVFLYDYISCIKNTWCYDMFQLLQNNDLSNNYQEKLHSSKCRTI